MNDAGRPEERPADITVGRSSPTLAEFEVVSRIGAAREELALGEHLTADSILRDLEDDLVRAERWSVSGTA
jgi:hypothetical protein